jgi:hypothetical protein
MNRTTLRWLISTTTIAIACLPASAGADAPPGRYVVTAGGSPESTVYDSKTKLTWQGTVTSEQPATLAAAKTYCAGIGSLLGGAGWRLPTIKELASIVDYTKPVETAFMIDRTAFFTMPNDVEWFWSATPVTNSASSVWILSFIMGYSYDHSVSYPANVRCVR